MDLTKKRALTTRSEPRRVILGRTSLFVKLLSWVSTCERRDLGADSYREIGGRQIAALGGAGRCSRASQLRRQALSSVMVQGQSSSAS